MVENKNKELEDQEQPELNDILEALREEMQKIVVEKMTDEELNLVGTNVYSLVFELDNTLIITKMLGNKIADELDKRTKAQDEKYPSKEEELNTIGRPFRKVLNNAEGDRIKFADLLTVIPDGQRILLKLPEKTYITVCQDGYCERMCNKEHK